MPATRRAYEHMRSAVLAGELVSGTWVAEATVATALGVSRTPVREAFVRLEGEGLLRLFPRRGALVLEQPDRDVGEVVAVLKVLETFAAWRVVEATGPRRRAVATRLRGLVDRHQTARSSGDVVGVARADRALHAVVVDAAGNRLLDDVHGPLQDRWERVAAVALRRRPSLFDGLLDDHRHMADLLERGDGRAYERVLRRHLAATWRAMGEG